ncbi:DUF6382 domain-containing protein [Oribacterium sinus]|uniref:FHA domain-containing protein n=1 Tax=Oribacterium sinus TaxID=237576 RepID=A0A930DJC3_9FIRM|nr:DUF6382 domain-containing protein [Oribacterium sinus]MBF1272063.1 FHA domain-containing protein [Oribacterium sinus]
MKEFKYENQGASSFLVYQLKEEDVLDNISLNMLTSNKAKGLASTNYMQMDTQRFIRYTITGKITANQFFARPVTKQSFMGIFKGITEAMVSAEEYMLDPACILLDLNQIYTDVSTGETECICLPVENEKEQKDQREFLKSVMFQAQFENPEEGSYVTRILNYLNSIPVFSSLDFLNLLTEMEREGKKDRTALAPAAKESLQQGVAEFGNAVANSSLGGAAASFFEQSSLSQAGALKQENAVEEDIPDIPVPDDIPKEERISLFYLLQHYNNNRAKEYMAQQKQLKARKEALKKIELAKKGGKKKSAASFNLPGGKAKTASAAPKAKKPSSGGFSFQVPGKESGKDKPGEELPGIKSLSNAPVNSQGNFAGNPKVSAPIGSGMNIPKSNPSVGSGMNIPKSNPSVAKGTLQPAKPSPLFSNQQEAVGNGGRNFGDTTVLHSGFRGEETSVLNYTKAPDTPKQPYLLRIKNGERIPVTGSIFRLGKEEKFVDYVIHDNEAISRSHANIISRNGQYFLQDNNSTNHSFLNGQQCVSNVELPLQDKASIRLGNEEFQFLLL